MKASRGNRLAGKAAVVTGGARGIGAAICGAFAKEGARVLIGDVLEREGRETAESIKGQGGEVVFDRMDVSVEGDWERVVSLVVATFGRLDILVNNAGIGSRSTVEETTLEDWQRTMDVNAMGAYLGIKYCAPAMAKSGSGSIINISSVAAMIGGGASVDYRASKGAMRALTKAMALRYSGQNIRVNSVHPGDVLTPMNRDYLADPARMASRLAQAPLGRLGTPEDIAHLAVYLASDESSYVTGAEIVIDGGRTAQ
ncbi:MAG: glucose 1-dehydrogenase [SAR202 cluster bacterium]|nr:glucose 1-dehydrogenase [SAR202 cluster bacterium]